MSDPLSLGKKANDNPIGIPRAKVTIPKTLENVVLFPGLNKYLSARDMFGLSLVTVKAKKPDYSEASNPLDEYKVNVSSLKDLSTFKATYNTDVSRYLQGTKGLERVPSLVFEPSINAVASMPFSYLGRNSSLDDWTVKKVPSQYLKLYTDNLFSALGLINPLYSLSRNLYQTFQEVTVTAQADIDKIVKVVSTNKSITEKTATGTYTTGNVNVIERVTPEYYKTDTEGKKVVNDDAFDYDVRLESKKNLEESASFLVLFFLHKAPQDRVTASNEFATKKGYKPEDTGLLTPEKLMFEWGGTASDTSYTLINEEKYKALLDSAKALNTFFVPEIVNNKFRIECTTTESGAGEINLYKLVDVPKVDELDDKNWESVQAKPLKVSVMKGVFEDFVPIAVRVVGNTLIVSNGLRLDKDISFTGESIIYQTPFLVGVPTRLKVPESTLKMTISGASAKVGVFPIYYSNTGLLSSNSFSYVYDDGHLPYLKEIVSYPETVVDDATHVITKGPVTSLIRRSMRQADGSITGTAGKYGVLGDYKVANNVCVLDVTMNPDFRSNNNLDKYLFSEQQVVTQPAVFYFCNFMTQPTTATLTFNLSALRDTEDGLSYDLSKDVRKITLNETLEGRNCTIVLDNRGDIKTGETITFGQGKYSWINASYPIEVKFWWTKYILDAAPSLTEWSPTQGWCKDPFEQTDFSPSTTKQFVGFIDKVSFDRDSKFSTVTLTCVDKSVLLKDGFSMNLSIYDGWDHVKAVQDIANRQGFSNANIITGDTRNFTLPYGYFKQEPIFMFPMTSVPYENITTIAKYLPCVVAFSRNGKLVYLDFNLMYNPSDTRIFKEKPEKLGEYDELMSLNVTKDMSQVHNEVWVEGVLYDNLMYIDKMKFGSQLVGRDITKNTNEDGFIPWLRPALDISYRYTNRNQMKAHALELFKRANRPRNIVQWRAWGQPDIQPWNIIGVKERAIIDDTAGNQTAYPVFAAAKTQTGFSATATPFFRVVSVTHALDADAMSYFSTIQGEKMEDDPFLRNSYPILGEKVVTAGTPQNKGASLSSVGYATRKIGTDIKRATGAPGDVKEDTGKPGELATRSDMAEMESEHVYVDGRSATGTGADDRSLSKILDEEALKTYGLVTTRITLK